jgi:hypothetical protein
MARQILFHMLSNDCKGLLGFLRQRDAVVVVERDSVSPDIIEVAEPCRGGPTVVLWNQSLLPSLEREYIARSNRGAYYRVSNLLPVLELFLPVVADWDGKPALTQGRVYGSFDVPNKGLDRWYDSIAQWIRINFTKNPVGLSSGYIGPAALTWYQGGGVLLPMLRPPVTPEWRSFVDAQHGRNRRQNQSK